MDTHYSGVLTNGLKLSFALNVNSASTLSGQTNTLSTDSSTVHPVFGVNTFSSGATLRFDAAATSATGGVYGLRVGSLIVPFFSYANGDTHTVSLDADYIAGLVTALVDGTPELTNYPFASPTIGLTTVSESFFFMNGHTGDSNSVVIDNISGSVPEPASLSLLAMGAVGLLSRRRRR